MAALWSGQKPADMSGSTTNPSDHKEAKTSMRTVSHTEKEQQQNERFILDLDQIGNIAKHPPPQGCAVAGVSIKITGPVVWVRL